MKGDDNWWVWPLIAAACYFGSGLLHSKWRYAATYGITTDNVVIEKEPHDCDFLKAPVGSKECHYDRQVATVRWARSIQSHAPIVSYDGGKTWEGFEAPAGVTVPQYSTVQSVGIGWEKVDE